MRVVVADTGPINYLVLIGEIDLLPKLFDRVLAPHAVFGELTDAATPETVRAWVTQPPNWFEVHPDPEQTQQVTNSGLDEGEQAALALAMAVHADLVLMDDRDGVAEARRMGLAVTGTLGLLDLAARRGLINLGDSFERLKTTSFHYRQGLLDTLLAKHRK